MPKVNLFLDSSALFAGIVSPAGAARALLLLGEIGQIELTISEQVITETERALARKAPQGLGPFRQAIRQANIRIVRNPTRREVQSSLHLMSHAADVPILLAAMNARVGFLVTLNRKHFIDDPQVAQRSGLSIGTPGEALAWVRDQLSPTSEDLD